MYPEGWLIDPEGKRLLLFEKDPMNPMQEGYIGCWSIANNGDKEFRYRKRTSKAHALVIWTDMAKQDWKTVEVGEQAA